MKQFQFFYRFTKGQQRGVMALFVMIIVLQAAYFFIIGADLSDKKEKSSQEKQWLAWQSRIDELKVGKTRRKDTIYPFNPNFISDYKGYTLGMTTLEIDRLHAFRKTGKYVNSADEFKNVTKVSDSLLKKLSPYFKFPNWVNEKQNSKLTKYAEGKHFQERKTFTKPEAKVVQTDINDALEEDLDKVYGIGPAFAKKILRRRAQLGAYVSMEQMHDFPEFSPAAVDGLKKNFNIGTNPDVTTININSASLNQLSAFPYFNKNLAKAIITKRSMKGKISGVEELLDINGFPVEKVRIIALYLEF